VRILVVGAGAVGGYFGAQLARAGRDVTFLVRPARAEQLRRDGLRVVTPNTSFTLTPHLALTGAIDGTYDVVLLATKAYTLDDAIADIAPAVGPQTTIVPLLNGMRHLDALIARFGAEPVLGGLCGVVSVLESDGTIRLLAEAPMVIVYGERAGGTSARVAALDAQLRSAGFDANASPRIMHEMWRKWITLASLGAINVLTRGTIGEVEAAGGAPVAWRVIDEAVAVAAAEGFAPAPEAVDGARAYLTAPGAATTSSLYRDLLAGNRVEGEHIIGDLVERARAHGLATPLLEAVRVSLRVYENGLAAR
jgi:2-dehydropantoate 2-reductase